MVIAMEKRRVLRNSGPAPGLLAYWHSWLKALVAMGPAIRLTYVRPLSVKKALSVKIIGPLSPKALKCKKKLVGPYL